MTLKVLVTGKHRKIAKDICTHLEEDRGYLTVKCDPSKSALLDLLLAELPKVIIICLGDETADTIRTYNVMRDVLRQGSCTVIVIANTEDEALFMSHTELHRVLFLSRPVSLFALYEKLNSIEEKIREDTEENLSVFREYINEDAGYGGHRKRILVVDDDAEQLIHIKELLGEFYDVTPVKSGEAAFRFLEKKIPDLILLDYLMPEEDGPAVLRRLRSFPAYEAIPVMFLTGMSEKKTVVKTLAELRPQGYVVKPAKKSDLVAKIIDVLG